MATIEKGIPLPPPRLREGGLASMLHKLALADVWDSMLIDGYSPETVRARAADVAKQRGVKFASRQGREGVRVWRVA